MTVWLAGVPRPDHGPGMVQRACPCGGGWVGLPDDECWWCAEATTRALEAMRRELLWPEWLAARGPRYDQLDPVDQAVWDATRGIPRGEASQRAWARRLADAVAADIVTEAEADTALARAESRRHAG